MKGGVRKRYGNWYYYFDLASVDGKRKKIERKAHGAKTKQEAERMLRKAIAEYENTGTFFEPSETSVHDYFHFWLEEYVEINLKHNTIENYKNIVNNHISPAIGSLQLRMLSPEILQKFINDKHREGFSRRTLTIIHSVLQNALKQAVYPYRLLKENPMQYVKLPRQQIKKPTKEDLKIITMGEIKKINDYLNENHPFYIPFHIGLNTGMRVSEVSALEWKHVDLNKKTIEVEQIVINVDREWVKSTPKTQSSYRVIDIGDTLVNILKKHKTNQKKNKLKYGEFYFESDYVCTKENGQHVTPSVIKYNTRKIKENLGIEFNFHSLRHTHATLLMESGAKIKSIQERLGHSRSSITIDTYSHLTEKTKSETVDIFESLINDN